MKTDEMQAFCRFLKQKFDVLADAKANFRKLTRQFLEEQRRKFSYFSPFCVGDLV